MDGLRLAAVEINLVGELPGSKIHLVSQDGSTDQKVFAQTDSQWVGEDDLTGAILYAEGKCVPDISVTILTVHNGCFCFCQREPS